MADFMILDIDSYSKILWSGQAVIFHTGALFPVINASMAIPGVFSPVAFEGRVLVDGGL